jgi:hypothetical protein
VALTARPCQCSADLQVGILLREHTTC